MQPIEERTKDFLEIVGLNTLTELIVDSYQRRPLHTALAEDVVNINIKLKGDRFHKVGVAKINPVVDCTISVNILNNNQPIIEPFILNGIDEGVVAAITTALNNSKIERGDMQLDNEALLELNNLVVNEPY